MVVEIVPVVSSLVKVVGVIVPDVELVPVVRVVPVGVVVVEVVVVEVVVVVSSSKVNIFSLSLNNKSY